MVDYEIDPSYGDTISADQQDNLTKRDRKKGGGKGDLPVGQSSPEKRVTFLEQDVHGEFRGRPSVPGPSAYETQPFRSSYMDSQFTENIGRQMRVPDQIRPYEESAGSYIGYQNNGVRANAMQQMSVPDRILVAGNDQHLSMRDNRPRELELDDMLYGFRGASNQPVQVQTPPRTLTVNQHSFPAANGLDSEPIEDGPMIAPFSASALSENNNMEQSLNLQAEKNMTSSLRGSKSIMLRSAGALTPSGRSGLPDTPGTRLVIDLYKRVEVLERENHYRYLREMVGYALVLGYVALKSMSFFIKR
ncbi:hypothetical protein BV898_09568 [Hypsibius exemplaris]|uniref:Mitochondrial fission factor n=1 Tax=Hypsibius exemplaris TaxID=2072580 RepID=A0A1W0WM43_HYPEX|nr:hypothetical protein BV898_09568 [Hypsibius exemplaris]